MERLVTFARRRGFDVLVVFAAVEGALEVALKDDAREPGTPLWLACTLVVIAVLPLLLRRRFPFGAPAALWVIGAAVSLVDGLVITASFGPFAAGLAASFLLGNLRDARQGRIGLATTVLGAAVVAFNKPDHVAGDLVFIPAVFVIAWLSGYALRERSVQAEEAEQRATAAEEQREASARLAVAEERARIARELHDIVAHAVSVMVLQVGAVRHKLPASLDQETAALKGVEDAGRTALVEMRRLLGAMRDEDERPELAPQPGLGSLTALLDEVGRAGLPVDLRVDGERTPLPAAIDLSAYRIIQEGLTNTLKHAGATHADVVVRYGPDDLRIEVSDDGNGGGPSDGLGHGLIGIRERVKIHGGDMTVGAAPSGGFRLATRMPLNGAST